MFFFNDRIKVDRFNVLASKSILSSQSSQIRKTTSSADISAYCVKQGWDPNDNLARARASRHLKEQRTDQRTQAGINLSFTELRNEEASAWSLATIQSAIQAFFASQSSEEASPIPLRFGAGPFDTSASPQEPHAEIDDFPSTTPINTNSDEYRGFALNVALDDDLGNENSSLPTTNASQFITWLSKINTVKCFTPTVLSFPKHVPCNGSSKNLPSYFPNFGLDLIPYKRVLPNLVLLRPFIPSLRWWKISPFRGIQMGRMLSFSRQRLLFPVYGCILHLGPQDAGSY